MLRIFSFFLLVLVVFSCKKTSNIIDVSSIDLTVNVDRFEQKFYNSDSNNLPELKTQYPYLFPLNNPDSVWVNKKNNDDERFLFEESQKIFGDFNSEKNQLNELFQHVTYYFPKFTPPKVITLISNLDYEHKVIYADSLLLISLDMYLGKNNTIYEDFPNYLKDKYEKSHLIVDVAKEIASKSLLPKNRMTFIEKMVEEGKKLYLINKFLPSLPENLKLGYTKGQIEWANLNEMQVWKYFIDNDLLFSSDSDLDLRFLVEAPFSKFYLEDDAKTPDRIAVWIGYQIVKSFEKNNEVTLQKILQTSNQEIFNKSNYKPKK